MHRAFSLVLTDVWQLRFRIKARMSAFESELKSYAGAGAGGAGASTDAVRNLVYDTLPKLLQMMSKFHDEIRDVECMRWPICIPLSLLCIFANFFFPPQAPDAKV